MSAHATIDGVPESALQGSMRDFRVPMGPDLLGRTGGFFRWQDDRRKAGLWPFSRSTESGPGAACAIRDDQGNLSNGVNFASQDYLSLASHPEIHEAARRAVTDFGVHSAGSPVLVGNTASSVALEKQLAEFCGMNETVLYSTGWSAGFGVIKGLVRSHDHVVMDALAHSCLQTGAQSATGNVILFRHLDTEHCRQRLATIRAKDPKGGIMVVTESLFSMNSDSPDLHAMQELAHEYGATLMVDVAHDLGALGPGGKGHIGMQGMQGKIDLVMGSFSKTFASNGGFVCTNSREVKEYLKFYSPSCTFSNALSPSQTSVVSKAIDIINSREGQQLRGKLLLNILSLRNELNLQGLEVYGTSSAIVAVKTGDEALARMTARELPELGLVANLVEFPAVAKGEARFRLQVMANHTREQIKAAADRMSTATAIARRRLESGFDASAEVPVAEETMPLAMAS